MLAILAAWANLAVTVFLPTALVLTAAALFTSFMGL